MDDEDLIDDGSDFMDITREDFGDSHDFIDNSDVQEFDDGEIYELEEPVE